MSGAVSGSWRVPPRGTVTAADAGSQAYSPASCLSHRREHLRHVFKLFSVSTCEKLHFS